MTLTEMRYIVALSKEKHFGKAAERCFISQPTLSLALKKVESRLKVPIFERMMDGVRPTPFGEILIAQAERVLEEALHLKELAQTASDPLNGALRIGAIYTVGPYLLPSLVFTMHEIAPQTPLFLKEDFTQQLVADLKNDTIDVAILALPLNENGIVTQAVYEEEFCVAVPKNNPLAAKQSISQKDLDSAPVLLLGEGNCFRDQVFESCPHLKRSDRKFADIEGNSLETLRYMVSSGVGVAILPMSAVNPKMHPTHLIQVLPFSEPKPKRVIALAWRVSFPRHKIIDVLKKAVLSCSLFGVRVIG